MYALSQHKIRVKPVITPENRGREFLQIHRVGGPVVLWEKSDLVLPSDWEPGRAQTSVSQMSALTALEALPGSALGQFCQEMLFQVFLGSQNLWVSMSQHFQLKGCCTERFLSSCTGNNLGDPAYLFCSSEGTVQLCISRLSQRALPLPSKATQHLNLCIIKNLKMLSILLHWHFGNVDS